jgi:hypothetical protein
MTEQATQDETGTKVEVNQDVNPFLISQNFTGSVDGIEVHGGTATGLGYTIAWDTAGITQQKGCRPEDLLVAIVARLSYLQEMRGYASENNQKAIDLIGLAFHCLKQDKKEP